MLRIRDLMLLALFLTGSLFLQAQATRTWVSGVGDDANPCSRTAPCKTFAGAISKTAPGGEINALDPGGFGAVTITKALTIDGGGGQVASIIVSGTNAIVVAAGASDEVVLRNIRINGLGTGLNGIQFVSGKSLHVDNCIVQEFSQNGINIAQTQASDVSVKDTRIEGIGGAGVNATTTTGQVLVSVINSSVEDAGTGVNAADHSRVTVRGSSVEHSQAGVVAQGTDVQATLDSSMISYNSTVNVMAGPGTSIHLAGNEVAYSAQGLSHAAGGKLVSFGDNKIHSNVVNGFFTADIGKR